uniref:4Fe-4S Wbl-type domain-containing protein n=1 Tax=Streptomyces sp. F12 TaxID=1436084 RepID=V9Z8G9_9ACTN|nr:hypothetical protein [Streptomyces sp. F12]AHE40398.1 hypothetical protein pFRL6_311 [Streptomyces sp. F12]
MTSPVCAYPQLQEPPALPAEAGVAACVRERDPFDELYARAGTPASRYVNAAAAVCSRCPLAATCPVRVLPRTSPSQPARRRRSSGTAKDGVLAYLRSNGEATAPQISAETGLTLTSVRSAVFDLAGEGRLIKRPAPRGEGNRVYLSLTDTEKGMTS